MTITARQILATLGVLLAMSLTALSVWWLFWNYGFFDSEVTRLATRWTDAVAGLWLGALCIVTAVSLGAVLFFLVEENPSFTVRLPWRRRVPKATVVSVVDTDRGPRC